MLQFTFAQADGAEVRDRKVGQKVVTTMSLGSHAAWVIDVGMRPSGSVGHRLHPSRLIEALSGRPVGLDINGSHDMAACNVGFKFLDRVIPTDRFVGTEDPWDLRTR